MILTGRRITGREALRTGLCERVVADVAEGEQEKAIRARVQDEAVQWAVEICEGAPLAVGAAFRAVTGRSETAEGREYEGLMGTEDRREGLEAFRERRAVGFNGR